MAPGCTTTQGIEMRSLKWLAVTAGMAALAACGGDETNMTNVEVNAVDENLMLPPADMNVDMNADMNVDIGVGFLESLDPLWGGNDSHKLDSGGAPLFEDIHRGCGRAAGG